MSLLARGRVVFHGPSDALPLYLRDVLVLPPPPAPEITYADHLLDVVIRAGEAEVERCGDRGLNKKLITYMTTYIRCVLDEHVLGVYICE